MMDAVQYPAQQSYANIYTEEGISISISIMASSWEAFGGLTGLLSGRKPT